MLRKELLSGLLTSLFFLSCYSPAQSAQEALHAPDGNSFSRIVSIFIAPIPDAPFTATVSTQWTRQTPDGATIVVKNYRMVARDSHGRVFEERRRFVPADSDVQPALFQMDYVDPAKQTRTVCHPQTSSCEIGNFFSPPDTGALPVGPMPDGKRYLSRENLGTKDFEAFETLGTRETITTSPGAAGNDQQVVLTKEFWYSPKLGINLFVKRIDPTQGTQIFTVSNISAGEPDARLFVIPAKYTVHDERAPTRASATK